MRGGSEAAAIGDRLEPYRAELRRHCYRLTGSLHEAEDLAQEALVRAWLRFDTWRGDAPLRSWLYAIATNACLDALRKRPPRLLPPALGPAAAPPDRFPTPLIEDARWLEPCPEHWLAGPGDDPEARHTALESVSLAFLAALQLLPPRQRAVVILCDVLGWRAAEVAQLLDLTVPAANSALHRARVTLRRHYPAGENAMPFAAAPDPATAALLGRYVRAWETDDVAGLVALLHEDATLSMPPLPAWYAGREAIGAVIARHIFGGALGRWRLCPTAANGDPAFAFYRSAAPAAPFAAFGIQVVTLVGGSSAPQIAALNLFGDAPALVAAFGFPPELSR